MTFRLIIWVSIFLLILFQNPLPIWYFISSITTSSIFLFFDSEDSTRKNYLLFFFPKDDSLEPEEKEIEIRPTLHISTNDLKWLFHISLLSKLFRYLNFFLLIGTPDYQMTFSFSRRDFKQYMTKITSNEPYQKG